MTFTSIDMRAVNHEAGHLAVAYLLGARIYFARADRHSLDGDHGQHLADFPGPRHPAEAALDASTVAMAGPVLEPGEGPPQSASDVARARRLATQAGWAHDPTGFVLSCAARAARILGSREGRAVLSAVSRELWEREDRFLDGPSAERAAQRALADLAFDAEEGTRGVDLRAVALHQREAALGGSCGSGPSAVARDLIPSSPDAFRALPAGAPVWTLRPGPLAPPASPLAEVSSRAPLRGREERGSEVPAPPGREVLAFPSSLPCSSTGFLEASGVPHVNRAGSGLTGGELP